MSLGLALAAVVGLSLGILGGGGSTLAVPIFVYVLGYPAKVAIAMSLAVVGATSAVAAVSHWREGNVDARTAAAFGAVAMVATYGGARLAAFVSGGAQLTMFGAVMLAAAFFMARGPMDESPRPGRVPLALAAGAGAGVGVLTGLVGVGGGFLIVPALVLLGGVPMKRAVGTSLCVIALNAAAGFAGYLGLVEVPWGFMAVFASVAAVGSVVGSRLVRRIPQRALRRAFAGFLMVMGVFILYRNGVAGGGSEAPATPTASGTPATVSHAPESSGGEASDAPLRADTTTR